MAEDYQMLEELGSGSFGVVYKALERSTGEYVAIKHIDLEGSDDDIREIQQEISLLSTCSSPFVTHYKTSFVRGVKLWIVMEFLGGGSCLDLLKPGTFPEAHIAIIIRELLLGLQYLHSTGKIHRDIKAANVLLSDSSPPKVKIADFGVAAQMTNLMSQRNTFVGTPFWMAPEVIQELGYDFKADIWSLGITAMELALGVPPRADMHPMKALMHIPKVAAPKLEGKQWSKDFKDFIDKCLIKDPDYRPGSRELLKHRFIRNAGKLEHLTELIDRHQRWDECGEKDTHARYYEETLKDLSPQVEQDEWVFDTVKPGTIVSPPSAVPQAIKRRKLARIDSAVEEEERMDFPSTNLPSERVNHNAINSHTLPSEAAQDIETGTVRKPSYVATPTARRVSAVRIPSGSTPTARRVSGVGLVKQPLGLDMSFGNGTSTARQFRRVSADRSREPQPEHKLEVPKKSRRESVASSPTKQPTTPNPKQVQREVTNPWEDESKKVLIWDENTPPPPVTHDFAIPPTPASGVSKYSTPLSQPQPIRSKAESRSPMPPPGLTAVTKESQLARQAYLSVVDPSFGEILAQTADPARREALSQLAQAWSSVNQMDPEGEWALLSTMIERFSNHQRLSTAIGLRKPMSAEPQLQQSKDSRMPSPRKSRKLEAEAGVGTPTPSKNPSPANTAQASDVKPPGLRRSNTTIITQGHNPASSDMAPTRPLRKQSIPTPTTAVSNVHGQAERNRNSSPKLVLSNNNPHLKSHRRRQSAFVTPSSGGYAGPESSFQDTRSQPGSASPSKPRVRSREGEVAARGDRRSWTDAVDEKKLPGYVERGLEHQGMLADVLYGRWLEGLKGRWAGGS